MPRRLPDRIDALRRAEQGAELCGYVALARMPRLAGTLYDREGEAYAELRFERDLQGIRFIAGRVAARLRLICQRCLEPMEVRVERGLALGLVRTESEAERLPAEYEPLLVGSGSLAIAEVIEDELILGLPLVALHAEGERCPVHTPYRAGDDGARGRGESPFAVLERLKRGH